MTDVTDENMISLGGESDDDDDSEDSDSDHDSEDEKSVQTEDDVQMQDSHVKTVDVDMSDESSVVNYEKYTVKELKELMNEKDIPLRDT